MESVDRIKKSYEKQRSELETDLKRTTGKRKLYLTGLCSYKEEQLKSRMIKYIPLEEMYFAIRITEPGIDYGLGILFPVKGVAYLSIYQASDRETIREMLYVLNKEDYKIRFKPDNIVDIVKDLKAS